MTVKYARFTTLAVVALGLSMMLVTSAAQAQRAGAASTPAWELVRPDLDSLRESIHNAIDHSALGRASMGVVEENHHREHVMYYLSQAYSQTWAALDRLDDPLITDNGTRLLLMDVQDWIAYAKVRPLRLTSDNSVLRKLENWGGPRSAGG